MYKNLLNEVQVVHLKAHQTAGTTDVESDGIDMAGFDGVMFVTTFGTGHATTNYAKVQYDSELAMGDSPADLEGTKQLALVAAPTICIDIYRPQQRYLRLHCTRGTSSTLESIYAIKYKARTKAVAKDTAVGGKIVISPDAGTA